MLWSTTQARDLRVTGCRESQTRYGPSSEEIAQACWKARSEKARYEGSDRRCETGVRMKAAVPCGITPTICSRILRIRKVDMQDLAGHASCKVGLYFYVVGKAWWVLDTAQFLSTPDAGRSAPKAGAGCSVQARLYVPSRR